MMSKQPIKATEPKPFVKDEPKRPYIVTAPNIFLSADPPGSGDALQGSHRRVAIGERLMLTDEQARAFTNKVLTPDLAVAQRAFNKAQKKFDDLGLKPTRADDTPVEWPIVEPQLP
jgi:hypothetical protein